MNLRNRDKLRKYRTEECAEAGNDDFYIIETILDIKENKNTGNKMKVKWLDFTEDKATWEDEKTIPKFIYDYYKDRSKLGTRLPDLVIKASKTIGNNEYYYISWTGEKGGKWRGEDFFNNSVRRWESNEIYQRGQQMWNKKEQRQTCKGFNFGASSWSLSLWDSGCMG